MLGSNKVVIAIVFCKAKWLAKVACHNYNATYDRGCDFFRFTHKVDIALISDYSAQIPRQEKKDLYTKLDDILLAGLHGNFEFCPGHAIDRQEMVEFLTSVVRRHLQDFPELQQILDLRDTVLTSRVKRAFPGVEYKRKHLGKEDRGKKVYP